MLYKLNSFSLLIYSNMGSQFILSSLFTRRKSNKGGIYNIDINKLPSQGYFYPDDLEIYLQKGNIDDHIIYHQGIGKYSNVFGFISTIKHILSNRVRFNLPDFSFNKVRAIDIFFIFIIFIKHTTGKKIYFNNIEFKCDNFIYFNFSRYIENYNNVGKTFDFGEWSFSLPSIGIETSLSEFSHEIRIRGLSDIYKNRNYNFIYFLGSRTSVGYENMINIIELFEDLSNDNQNEVNDIVNKFEKSGLYYLVELDVESLRVNPLSLKEIWSLDNTDVYIEYDPD